MVQLPSNLKKYRREAEANLLNGAIKEIEFSGSTYQVLVDSSNQHHNCWVFLQLEGKGQIKDAFCSCEETEETLFMPCVHIATAYLGIYGSHSLPLHQRFARSLWNHLCRLYADRLGDDPSIFVKIEPGYYIYQTSQDKINFSLKGKTDKAVQAIEDILWDRPPPTEENSLKFSNLPHEEIALWREGRPSDQLRYELSFWSDLAKWLFYKQEAGEPYEINYKYSKQNLPNWIGVEFEDGLVGFHLTEANWPLIIPSLSTVQNSLTVRDIGNQGIARISYDKKTGTLHIEGEKIKSSIPAKLDLKKQKGILLGEWL